MSPERPLLGQSSRRRTRARTRRGFLVASSAALFAGCSSRNGPTGDRTPTETDAKARTTASAGTAPSTPAVTADDFPFGAKVLAQATEESPARLELSLTNDAERTVELGFQPRPPFGGVVGENDDGAELVIVPDNDTVSPGGATRTGECWVWEDEVLVIEFLDWRTAEPGRTFTERYSVYYGHRDGDGNDDGDGGCAPDGTYVFENTVMGDGGQFLALSLSLELADGRVSVGAADVEKPW